MADVPEITAEGEDGQGRCPKGRNVMKLLE